MNHLYNKECEGIKICDYATSKILISPVRKFRPDLHFVLCSVNITIQSFIAWLRTDFFPKVAQAECNWTNFCSLCNIQDGTGWLYRSFLALKARILCNRYWQNSPYEHLGEKEIFNLYISFSFTQLTAPHPHKTMLEKY